MFSFCSYHAAGRMQPGSARYPFSFGSPCRSLKYPGHGSLRPMNFAASPTATGCALSSRASLLPGHRHRHRCARPRPRRERADRGRAALVAQIIDEDLSAPLGLRHVGDEAVGLVLRHHPRQRFGEIRDARPRNARAAAARPHARPCRPSPSGRISARAPSSRRACPWPRRGHATKSSPSSGSKSKTSRSGFSTSSTWQPQRCSSSTPICTAAISPRSSSI